MYIQEGMRKPTEPAEPNRIEPFYSNRREPCIFKNRTEPNRLNQY